VPAAAVNLAESLMMPRETTRRHVNALIAKGHLVREVDGVLISPTLLGRPELSDVGNTVSVSIRRMVRRLRLIGALVHPG
jgi:DNA-binding IclR family transcriptional regulator